MADDEKKEAGDKNDPRRLHSFPLIRVSCSILGITITPLFYPYYQGDANEIVQVDPR